MNSKSGLRASLLVLLVLSVHCSSKVSSPTEPGGSPPPVSLSLPVPFFMQQTQEWCWAASIQMVSQFYGVSLSQCGILSTELNIDCCSFVGSACVQPAPTIATIQAALRYFANVKSAEIGRPLSFAEVVAQISGGHPVIAVYESQFSGHVVVIFGYNSSNKTLAINDPIFGSFANVPYGASFTYGGTLIWADTLTTSR
jgi:hypothetical protein